MNIEFLQLLNVLVTGYLLGLIWLVQLIHYPGFLFVSPSHFLDFHQRHSSVLGLLAGPAMIFELVIAMILLILDPHWISGLSLFVVMGTWISTFSLSVPLHHRLANGFDRELILRLVSTNWIRTILWTLKAGLILSSVFIFK